MSVITLYEVSRNDEVLYKVYLSKEEAEEYQDAGYTLVQIPSLLDKQNDGRE